METNVQIQLEVPWEAVGEWSLETTLQHFWYQTVLFTVQETFLGMIDDLGKNSLLDRVAQLCLTHSGDDGILAKSSKELYGEHIRFQDLQALGMPEV